MDNSALDTVYLGAFEKIQPRLDQMASQELRRVRVKATETASAVLALIESWEKGGWRSRLEEFSKTTYWDFDNYDTVTLAARALWYIRYKLQDSQATTSTAKLSEDIASRAFDVRSRMRLVCEFVYHNSPEFGSKLAYLRSGSGYIDLAYDLFGYVQLYQANTDLIKAVPIHYRADDAEEAVKLAQAILAELIPKGQREPAQWMDYQVRALTLLTQCYDEVRAAGLFLGRGERDIDTVFPLFYTLARSTRFKKQPESPSPPTPSPTPEPSPVA